MSNEGKKAKNYTNLLVCFIILNLAIYLYASLGLDYLLNIINSQYLMSIIESTVVFAILGLVAVILTEFLSSNIKAILVFWRIKNTLPGHRSFSKYAKKDPRINENVLIEKHGKLPTEPKEQNNLWYSIYKKHEFETSVFESQRLFLLTRDLTGLSMLIIIIYLALVIISKYWFNLGVIWSQPYLIYLLIQYFAIAITSQNLGKRYVCNVLAQEAIYTTKI